MLLTTAQAVRLRISDRWRYGEEARAGDGTGSAFKLAQGSPFSTLVSASVQVAVAAGWSATGASCDTALGVVTFSGVISANSAWRAGYQWAVFGDDEIDHFILAGGTVAGAALEAVRSLLFDSLRRAKWAAPDGTEFDDTAAQRTLLEMENRLVEEIDRSDGPAGGIESWSEQQAYYSSEYLG